MSYNYDKAIIDLTDQINRLEVELALLREFYGEVRRLTAQHDSIDDAAVVYANKLGEALSRVNSKWWEV